MLLCVSSVLSNSNGSDFDGLCPDEIQDSQTSKPYRTTKLAGQPIFAELFSLHKGRKGRMGLKGQGGMAAGLKQFKITL
jgi:hypothetical protein